MAFTEDALAFAEVNRLFERGRRRAAPLRGGPVMEIPDAFKGDVNITPARTEWVRRHLGAKTKAGRAGAAALLPPPVAADAVPERDGRLPGELCRGPRGPALSR